MSMYFLLFMLLCLCSPVYAQTAAPTVRPVQDPYAIAAQVNCNPDSQIPLTNQQCADLRTLVLLHSQQCIDGGGIVVLLQGPVVECDYPIVAPTPTWLGNYTQDDQLCQIGVTLLQNALSPELEATICDWFPSIGRTNTVERDILYANRQILTPVANGCNIGFNSEACSNNGKCYAGFSQSYCVCDAGHTGQ